MANAFELKPEGLCRAEVCVPIPPGREAEFVQGSAVNLAAFWPYRGGHLIHDASGDVWVATSDRELRDRLGGNVVRIVGGGTFAREI